MSFLVLGLFGVPGLLVSLPFLALGLLMANVRVLALALLTATGGLLGVMVATRVIAIKRGGYIGISGGGIGLSGMGSAAGGFLLVLAGELPLIG